MGDLGLGTWSILVQDGWCLNGVMWFLEHLHSLNCLSPLPLPHTEGIQACAWFIDDLMDRSALLRVFRTQESNRIAALDVY